MSFTRVAEAMDEAEKTENEIGEGIHLLIPIAYISTWEWEDYLGRLGQLSAWENNGGIATC